MLTERCHRQKRKYFLCIIKKTDEIEDKKLLESDKDFLWKSFSLDNAEDEFSSIIKSLDKCPLKTVNVAVNCGGATKARYDANITRKTQETCADSIQCSKYCDKEIEATEANAKKICKDDIEAGKMKCQDDIEAEKKRKEEAEKRKRLEAIPEYWDSEYY